MLVKNIKQKVSLFKQAYSRKVSGFKHAYNKWVEAHKWLISIGKWAGVITGTLIVTGALKQQPVQAHIMSLPYQEDSVDIAHESKEKAKVQPKKVSPLPGVKPMTTEERKSMLKQFANRKAWLDPKGAAVANARRIEQANGVPMWLTLAQGMAESVLEKELSKIGTDNCNLFGHKPHSGNHGLEQSGQPIKDKRGLDGKRSDHQKYTSWFWSFYHHGRMVKKNWLRGIDAVAASPQQVIDCMCAEANGLKGYNYAEACGGKDKLGNYNETVVVDGKRIATYESTLMKFIERYKLLELR